MARYVITAGGTIAGTGYTQPPRALNRGHVLELSAAEVTALNAAGITVRAVTARDQLGEGAAAANSN